MNAGEIPYNDLHLSHMAQELRYGFYGQVDWAILEVCDIEEVGNDYRVYLTAAGGISPTAARLAKHVIPGGSTPSITPMPSISMTFTSHWTPLIANPFLSSMSATVSVFPT